MTAKPLRLAVPKIPLREYLGLFRRYLRPFARKAWLLALVLTAGIGLQLLRPQFLRGFIDGALAGESGPRLVRRVAYFALVALFQQLLAALGRYLGEDVGWSATNLLRNDLAAHCLRLDMSFHKEHAPGELIERVDGDVNGLAGFFSNFVIGMLGSVVLLLGILAILFHEDWRVGLGLTVFAFLALLVLLAVRNVAVPYWEAVRGFSARFYGFLSEHLAGTEDIQTNGGAAYVMRRFHEQLRQWFPVARRADVAGYSMWIASSLVFTAGNVVALALGARLWQLGALTVGSVYLVFDYTQQLRRPIERIRTQMQDLQRASASIVRVRNLFDTSPRIKDGGGSDLPAGALGVRFDGVSFSYGNSDTVLHDLSFTLPPGRVLGLLGRTGSGKTTLARLLLRFYDPQEGRIELSGVPIDGLRLGCLRRRVGLVTQDVQLFAGTVRDNLTFFDPGVPERAILDALAELGLGAWLAELPEGLETKLGSGSRGLSAGEAQLLAFARLYLADPGLMILDEASSRLDPATEQLIEQAVGRLLRGRTALVIAHRLATVMRAEEIMILEDGRILEHGDREALTRDPASRFARLLRAGLEDVLA